MLVILERAEQLLSMQNQIVGTDDRNNYNELHMNFCGLLTVSVLYLGESSKQGISLTPSGHAGYRPATRQGDYAT